MLLNFKTSMFKSFENMVELSMDTNKGKNTHVINNKNILKSSIIYGSNNSGKSNFILSIKTMKDIFRRGSIKGYPFHIYKNYFHIDKPVSYEIEFIIDKYIYVYGVDIYSPKKLGEYLFIDDKNVFSRGDITEKDFIDSKIFKSTFIQESFKYLNDYELFVSKALSYNDKANNKHISNIYRFFKKLKFYDSNNSITYFDLSLEYLEDKENSDLFNSIISKADTSLVGKRISDTLGLDNITEEQIIDVVRKEGKLNPADIEKMIKSLKIKSIYSRNGKTVEIPVIFDSVGTNKFSNLVLLLLKSLSKGDILLIDEIDNSLHYRLTRELIKLMNSRVNNSSQFIMTAHDIKLLTPLIFRKEQINFIDRNKDRIDMFSLGDFTDVRNTTNFENLYTKNHVGALPMPELEEVIKEWQKNEKRV